LILPEGGLALLDRIRAVAQPELGWEDERWAQEVERYRELWRRGCSPPAP